MPRKDKTARDLRIGQLLQRWVSDPPGRPLADVVERELQTVFSTTVWGFREILLVIAVARHLDPAYLASRSFYDCNPRALYEGPIRDFLSANGVPHRKSGPLNIAKAASGINTEWAGRRDPVVVSQAVVRLVRQIEGGSPADVERFGRRLVQLLMEEAAVASALAIATLPEADIAFLSQLCRQLIDQAPDGGNTPQRIVGALLRAYHESMGTGVRLEGDTDSASTTSTTSKKPGDIVEWPTDGDGLPVVYEVTVKPFGKARVEESADNVQPFIERNEVAPEVIVICRPQDAHPSASGKSGDGVHLGSLSHRGVTYQFIDIYEWITAQLARMPPQARLDFYSALEAYINDPSRSRTVKELWRKLRGADAQT